MRGTNASPTAAGRSESGGNEAAGDETRPSPANPGSAAEARDARLGGADRDQVDAVNQMFAEFELAYHNQYRKAFPDRAALNRAKKYWLGHLGRFGAVQINRAAAELAATREFMPTLADVVAACRGDTALFGLPSTRRAYEEACLAPAPKAAQAWSHEAVYLAGAATGWSLLAGEPESVSFPQFEYHYQDLCRQVVEGTELRVQRPPPLPETIDPDLDGRELSKRLGKLRSKLGL